MAFPRFASEGGGARRDRTADLLHAMQALSQLSYGPDRNQGTAIGNQKQPEYRRLTTDFRLSFLFGFDVAANDVGDVGVLFFLLLDEGVVVVIIEGFVDLDLFAFHLGFARNRLFGP